MAAGTIAAHEHAELIALVGRNLSTRALDAFAEESRLDGESLRDAVERYEVDYAWQVLCSDRLRDETLALLALKLEQPVTAAQQRCVSEVLRAVAQDLPSDLLMSFDNDLAELLAASLHEQGLATEEAAALG